ncbi:MULTISPECIES: ribosome maturation protein RimP [unclassified Sphingomonas]|uniref:ribosome maturation protein RimP n=1 Tax=unclassified Sphingomonas TaxID=196159 RepID=UPI000E109BEB|nr:MULTISPECIES: ribosome maturation protein RimP [unclassified Sphingomonas]AXJ94538.1 ribosome maturation factor [Sphingomonas sp. FARSPH]
MVDIALLTQLIEPEAKALGFDLVRVKMFGGKSDPTLQVMAERPATGQLTIDDCADLSRRISDKLDALEAEGRDPIPDAYRLEVSSPGIDRPLTRPQDYANWAGHEAKLTLAEKIDNRKILTGDLVGIEGENVTIDVRGYRPMTVALAQIADAKLTITDRLIAATAPLSTDGADEFEEASDDTDAADTNDNDALKEGHA